MEESATHHQTALEQVLAQTTLSFRSMQTIPKGFPSFPGPGADGRLKPTISCSLSHVFLLLSFSASKHKEFSTPKTGSLTLITFSISQIQMLQLGKCSSQGNLVEQNSSLLLSVSSSSCFQTQVCKISQFCSLFCIMHTCTHNLMLHLRLVVPFRSHMMKFKKSM